MGGVITLVGMRNDEQLVRSALLMQPVEVADPVFVGAVIGLCTGTRHIFKACRTSEHFSTYHGEVGQLGEVPPQRDRTRPAVEKGDRPLPVLGDTPVLRRQRPYGAHSHHFVPGGVRAFDDARPLPLSLCHRQQVGLLPVAHRCHHPTALGKSGRSLCSRRWGVPLSGPDNEFMRCDNSTS